MATLLRPGSSLMSRTETRQLVVLYHGHCHIKMSHHSVLGGCRCEPRDNAGGKGFCNQDVAGAPERKERRVYPQEGEQWVWGWTSWGENKALVWEGLEGSPREAVIKVPVKCVLVSAALRG